MLKVNITSFQYPGSDRKVLSNVNFQLAQGKQLAVLGESGCGKSTLLHLIYGLLNLNEGTIFYGKKQLYGPSHNLIPGHHFMKLVSQDLNLMPFTSVAENIGEHLQRIDATEDADTIEEVLSVVGLSQVKNRKVNTLSGGQKQRVALAKALVKAPKIMLLDEPFSSIDTFRKNDLRRHIFSYLKKHSITCVFATHDSEEALAFSDKILILKEGQKVQLGAPKTVYSEATSRYEKGFYGEVSTIPGGLISKNEINVLPHELKISEKQTLLVATVHTCYFKGHFFLIECDFNNTSLFVAHGEELKLGSQVYITLA